MARSLLLCLLLWLPLVVSSGVRPMVVVGSSMEPVLLPGQLVLLHGDYYRTHPLQQDDVVVPQGPGEFLLNGRFHMDTTELVSRANRMRSRQGKPAFQLNGQAPGAADAV